jgi:hypothetical protein
MSLPNLALLHRNWSSKLLVQLPAHFYRVKLCALAAVTAFWVARPLHAEIILDDFDDRAEVVEISTGFGQHPVITDQLGGLGATRELLFTASQTEPNEWSFDADIRSSSALSAELRGHSRTSTNSAIITYPVRYSFSPIDVTEQGANNAFLFDFQSHQGTEAPLFFRVAASAPSPSGTSLETFAAFTFDFNLSTTPFTTIVPFTDFTVRGGVTPAPDFSALGITSLIIDFFFRNPSEDIQWFLELDRIRIGHTPIPEPIAAWLAALGALLSTGVRLRQCRGPCITGGFRHAKNN